MTYASNRETHLHISSFYRPSYFYFVLSLHISKQCNLLLNLLEDRAWISPWIPYLLYKTKQNQNTNQPNFFWQMHILSVSGPVVTAAGYEDQLAIVSHASDCLPSGDQVFVRILICSSVKLNSDLIYVVPKLLYSFK